MSDLAALLPDLSTTSWLLVVLGALIVGFSKTALPGAATLAAGAFALAMPAKESTAALLLLLILGDMTALWVYRREPDWRTLVRLLPSAMVGVIIGVFFFAAVDDVTVRVTIGVILLALVTLTLVRRAQAARRTAAQAEASDTPPATRAESERGSRKGAAATAQGIGYGLLGGFTTMVANAAGPVMSLYLLMMRMPVLTFLGTSAWFFAVINLFKLPFSAGLGLFTAETLAMDALLVPVVLLAAFAGAKVARRISQSVFDKLVLGLTVLAAIGLLIP
ncbi:sulfite exporter TauE/SafE family protein [Brachybacterium sp. GU-2]|uniref:sulfite exporter TauE/SafE family protein n=1 Tax=Brachybacterium sp. GU-2 TaxID=3069708 RepID=UPI00280A4EB9|nr:sulfite exporter TauE/SafE family protein [Brachybacterium sp. GU-2]WME22883.1 sulfite exporter TauE/SafE family protein [Brachybacterium sp. GU-2]